MSDDAARKSFWRRLYEGWLVIAGHFGEAQTLSILGIVYVFLIGPISIILKRGDPLHKRPLAAGTSGWSEADTAPPDLERARRLF